MKCFYAPAEDAVGTCKSCGKGLSADYLIDLGKRLACRDRCEADVQALISLIDHNISSSATTSQILQRGSQAGYGTGVFLTVMGFIFLLTSIRESQMGITLYLGIGFLAYGIWSFYRSYRYAKIVSQLPESKNTLP